VAVAHYRLYSFSNDFSSKFISTGTGTVPRYSISRKSQNRRGASGGHRHRGRHRQAASNLTTFVAVCARRINLPAPVMALLAIVGTILCDRYKIAI
jgi:hypothetical protein